MVSTTLSSQHSSCSTCDFQIVFGADPCSSCYQSIHRSDKYFFCPGKTIAGSTYEAGGKHLLLQVEQPHGCSNFSRPVAPLLNWFQRRFSFNPVSKREAQRISCLNWEVTTPDPAFVILSLFTYNKSLRLEHCVPPHHPTLSCYVYYPRCVSCEVK